jgi:Ca2+-binding EF-hand superfamily protein
VFPNGFLFKEDFFKLYKELYPHKENTTSFLSLLFDGFDKDKSGVVTFSEFLIAVSLSGQNDAEKKLRLAFSIYDYNNNGKLEREEIDAIVQGLRGLADSVDQGKFDQFAESDLNGWDKDKNGYLTEDEFIKFILAEPLLKKYFLSLIKVHE